jgi:phosphoribosylformimino-5-aminoimidazole carboxamide ribotide isomerase
MALTRSQLTIIPAIDLLDGNVVRLTQGDYDQVSRYDLSPGGLAKSFEEHGAKRLHIVDLNGAKDGSLVNVEAIRQIRDNCNLELELGGGIRNQETINTLKNAGISYFILGSLLVKNWDLAEGLITDNPNQIIAGIDAKDGYMAIHGWLEKSELKATDLAKKLNSLAIESIIYTDIAKDGMLSGPNIPELNEIATVSDHPIIASGGISSQEDIETLATLTETGILGCITGKAIYENKLNLNTLWK